MYKKLLLLALFFPIISKAAIYQSTDNRGAVSFSDTPRQGASVVVLPDENYSSDAKPITIKSALNDKDFAPSTKETTIQYKNLSITHPENAATFLNNKGEVNIGITLKPGLRANDKLIILLDNKVVDSTKHGSMFIISNVDRGTHTLQAQIQDATGRTLLTSNTVTFYMQRPMVREVKVNNDI